ncbi:MAG: transposase [Stigonema ocellatum SAG 48.90 = DSM 106950]|nr:transposase [Stigonema ocellatum SAG 48.90 = DSM 106950]
MKLVEKRVIKGNHEVFRQIDEMSFASKNLYNSANFIARQAFFDGGERQVPKYESLYHTMKDAEQYKGLPAKVSQQVLRLVAQNWTSYFAALDEFASYPGKFKARPRPPKYLEKDGRFCLVFTEQATSKKELRKRSIKLSGIDYCFDTGILLGKINVYCQSRIVPKLDHYVLEIIYEVADLPIVDSNYIAAIDFGVNNLMAITSNVPGFQPVLINGRPLKSTNQFYNSKRALLASINRSGKSKRLRHISRRRNHIVKDYLHRASTYVINLLAESGITKLVLGKNKGWKDSINIGSRNNQNFVQIPHAQLINILIYKGAMRGIKVIVQEESYTSKASFLDKDSIPTYKEKPEHWKPCAIRSVEMSRNTQG